MPHRRHALCYVKDHQWSHKSEIDRSENDETAILKRRTICTWCICCSPRISQYSTIKCQFHETQMYIDSNSGKYVQFSWDTHIFWDRNSGQYIQCPPFKIILKLVPKIRWCLCMLIWILLCIYTIIPHSHNTWAEPSMLRRMPFGLYNLHSVIHATS